MKSPCATCGQQTEKSSTESPHAALKRPVTLLVIARNTKPGHYKLRLRYLRRINAGCER